MKLKQRISLLFVTLCLFTAMRLFVRAQDDTGLVFAAVQDGQPTVFGLGETPLVIDSRPNSGISSLVWSPDGNHVAYIQRDSDLQAHVYAANVTAGAAPVRLNTGALVPDFPITFSAEGQLIYVGQPETSRDVNEPYQAEIKRIAPLADAQPETLAIFGYTVGCRSSELAPPSWPYWDEAGYAGSALILKMTDYGLLHSANCYGFGLALLNLQTGVDTLIGSEFMSIDQQPTEGPIGRVMLAPDGKTAAGVHSFFTGTEAGLSLNYGLVFIDLAAQIVTQVVTEAQPDQLAWSSDGSTLFYSVQENPVNIAASLTPEQLATAAPVISYGSAPESVQVLTYTASIHQLNVMTGEDTLLYTADAYAIGRMAVTPDGQYLVASQVASPERWMAALADQAYEYDSSQAILYRIPLLTREAPVVIGENLTQFTLRPPRQ